MDNAPPHSKINAEKYPDEGTTPTCNSDPPSMNLPSMMELVDENGNKDTSTIVMLIVHKMYVLLLFGLKRLCTLLLLDRDYILTHGAPLNDKHINILKAQCPHILPGWLNFKLPRVCFLTCGTFFEI